MSALFEPTTSAELADAVRSAPKVIASGGDTKARLAEVSGYTRISTVRLSGVLDYDPSEFTFTAFSGTRIRDIVALLQEKGQYLPFDPAFCAAGATLGGTVASGLSGPGRFRYGGIRDFILGVRFVDGDGRLLRLGGKVVKNAAGFDLPKFFVGSLGRFGALAELTFKVFPKATSYITVKLPVRNAEAMAQIFMKAGNSRWELDALDGSIDEAAVFARVGAPGNAAAMIAQEVLQRWPGAILSREDADRLWERISEFQWAHAEGVLLKIPLTPTRLPELSDALSKFAGARTWISSGGNVAFLSLPTAADVDGLDLTLKALGLGALTLRGQAPLWRGARTSFELERAIKTALDPINRFPSLND